MLMAPASPTAGQAPVPPVPQKPTLDQSPVRLVQKDEKAGLELWETRLGPVWIPAPGQWVISHLEWEQVDRKVYDHPGTRLRKGDIVIDAGAHVGLFTRVALRAGARMVIAIEPQESNIGALRRNFEPEIRSGQVRIVTEGLWDRKDTLRLRLAENSNDAHSLVFNDGRTRFQEIRVDTLDSVCASLKLPRVDFVKMDIEGAEPNALKGARQVLNRWRPRLAISAYHVAGDAAKIAALVWEVRPDYRVGSGDLVRSPHGAVVPKVLFFY
jgi:FkbM family methyltransferase